MKVIGFFVACGDYLFAMQQYSDDEGVFVMPSAANGQPVEITITHKCAFSLDQSRMIMKQQDVAHKVLQFLNVLIKSVLRAQDFKQIGKLPKYFQQNERVDIRAHNLEMWPGYLTQSRLLADGIFLNVDTAARFIQKTSILDWIKVQQENGRSQKQIAAIYDSSN